MTHIAAGFVGLEVAQRPFDQNTISSTYKNMANQLWREGVAKAMPNGEFASNCRQLNPANTLAARFTAPTFGCWDTQKTNPNDFYHADMFPVDAFYVKYGFSRTLAPGQTLNFNYVNENINSFPTWNAVYWPGRYTAYVTMGKKWLDPANRPAMGGSGRYKLGLIRNASWYMVNSGSNTTPTVTTALTSPRPADATFTIEDLTPATPYLANGDVVAIRNKDGYYLEATNGGGSTVVARYTSVTPNAKFTIWKGGPYPTEPIGHSDLAAFKTSNGVHWLTAPVGGSLSTTTTSGGDSFTIERFKTE
jgi:hypothetical protein